MKITKTKVIKGIGVLAVAGVLSVTTTVFSATSKVVVPPKQIISDEQQGINAVRTAKASVVSIIGTSKNKQEQVSGTGFIVESNGYIVSNSHVVSDNKSDFDYTVIFIDGSKFPASIIGVDRYNDIALIKIEAGNLGTLRLGNSDVIETGQTVFAIGNSLGKYQNTVTRGVVSGLGRDINIGDALNPRPRLQNLIQTDAAINPGNSGGPLINMNAEVIGMNTLIDTQGQGLGFAVPANTIKDAIAQLRNTGKVSRPYLGITFQTIDASIQTGRSLPTDQGALVLSVASGGPASQAKLRVGDIIQEINREKLTDRNQLDGIIQRFKAGDQVMLKVLRGKEQIDMPLVLGEFR